MGIRGRLLLFTIGLLGMGYQQTALSLTCSEVRQLTMLYFKMHYSFNKFDDELSKRTLDSFIKLWDPGKLYFYEDDIKKLKSEFETQLDDQIGKIDCQAIDKVVNVFSKRFSERQRYAEKLIDYKFDFKKDEYMVIDRKKVSYAKTQEELNERWRKRMKFQFLSLNASMNDKEKVKEKLKKRNELAIKRHTELTRDKVFGVFLNAFSTSLDPHSSYLPVDELEDFRIRTRLSLEGIGASLRSEEGFTIVTSLVKGGAAEKSGLLKINDKIIAVAQATGEPVDVIDMDLQEVVKLIRGARGTTVKLTIIRESSNKTQKMIIPIVREKIQLVDQQAASKSFDVQVDHKGAKKTFKVGVINLPSFYIDFEGKHQRLKNYRSSSQDTIRELEKLKKEGINGLIIDLRNNGGGSLEESINLAGLFFDKGPVVQVKAPSGETEAYADRDGKTYYDGPLVVMINRHSASASEIFAGAIQDYGRGIIVGDSHTFGKGTVQNLNDVAPTLGAIKVTVNQFYRPLGATTQLKGVDSDITLASLVDELEIGEKYYDYALPFETIKKAEFKGFDLVTPYVKQLKQASLARLAADNGFQEVFNELEEFRKNKEERSRVSLKEKPPEKNEPEESQVEASEENVLNLQEDIYLQEGVRIMGDYLQLLDKKPLGKVALPGVKPKKQTALTPKTDKKPVAEKKDEKKAPEKPAP